MRRLGCSKFWIAIGGTVASLFATVGPAIASTPPYPNSKVITGITWDLSTVTSMRKAAGSDIWAMTWGSDGNLYGAWGDGGGFDGTQVSKATGRASLGFARITGTPVAGNSGSYTGKNVWGQAPNFAENQATFGGKVSDLFSVNGVLYAQGGFWTSANCGCSDPTIKSGSNPADNSLAWSADLGKTWTLAPWKAPKRFGATIQFGQNYKGAFDPSHLYFYYLRDANTDPSHAYLRRMLVSVVTADPSTPGHYEYFTGTDSNGAPIWSTTEANARPVFTDPNTPAGAGTYVGAVWNAPLGRYIAIEGHGDGTGQVGIFESQKPWGPWATVAYYDDWGGFNETAGPGNGMQFPGKWISSDGKTLWAVFSGINTFDSFNVAKAVLTVASVTPPPQITAPAAGTVFSPGEQVTAQASGSNLSWLVTRSTSSTAIATGTGTSITFTVPTNATASETIRITLTGSGGSTFRDYDISVPQSNSVAAYWKLDEGSGTSVSDASGNGNTGTLINGPKWTTGKLGDALSFSGGSDLVKVSGAGSLANLYRKGLTVSAWIKPVTAGGGGRGRVVDKDNNDAGWFLAMYASNVAIFQVDQFATSQPNRLSTAVLTPNTWQHIAATWDGSTNGSNIHIYVNGVPADGVSTNGSGAASDDTTAPLTIGNRLVDVARGFNGSIDDVHVFNRVLSPAEIKNLVCGTVNVTINFVSTGQTYTLATAQVGANLYTDRDYTITSIPSSLVGDVMIQTANDDKAVTANPYLKFTIDRSATVYVVYSSSASQLPAWLNDGSWTAMAGTFDTTDPGGGGSASPRTVYKKSFGSGQISLGGNLASPAGGPSGYSNYVVLVGH